MELPAGEVHVWFHEVEVAPERLDGLSRILSSAELAKALRYHFDADRRRSIVARAALRIHLSRYCGIDPAAIVIAADAGTKPEAPGSGVHFNVSHAGDFVGIAFSSSSPVGFDVERVRAMRDAESIAKRYFSPDEQRAMAEAADPDDTFFQIWTAKEALVKGTGKGLSSELAAFTVPVLATELTPIRTDADDYKDWRVAAVAPPRAGYRAAVAARQSKGVIRVNAGAVPM
jgi:4'-phosphopantetheinyl transferase